jgi:phage-related minor tail protein
VTAFADGGVVNQPTMFPMANGAGLMGEAGPEAVMPLKRGKNGKLGVQVEGGSQQPIVINQSFNFSANGDESVKRIIAQEAPKIANLTQKQILDQRARGGVWKGTFG